MEQVSLVLSIKQSNPNEDTTEFEKQIDELVYKLYNVAPEEQKIIEAGN